MVSNLPIPSLEKSHSDLNNPEDLAVLKSVWDKENEAFKAETGRDLKKLTLLVMGNKNVIEDIIECSTSEQRLYALVQSGGQQIKQFGNIDGIKCVKFSV